MGLKKVLIAMVTFCILLSPVRGDTSDTIIELETGLGPEKIIIRGLHFVNSVWNSTRLQLLQGPCAMAFNKTHNPLLLLAILTVERPTWVIQPPILPGERLLFVRCIPSAYQPDEMRFHLEKVKVTRSLHGKFCGCIDATQEDTSCEGDSVLLGSSYIPRSQIKSMTKCNTTSCFSGLTVESFKSELRPQATAQHITEANKVHTRRIFNNGSGSIEEVYTAEKTYVDKFSLTRRNSFSSSSSDKNVTDFEASLTAQLKVKPPSFLKVLISGGIDVSGSLSASFQKAWEKSSNSTNETESSTVVETKQTRKISQTIKVPPCTAYEVSSSITMLDDVEVEYTVFYRVSLRTKYINAASPATIQLLKKVNLAFVEEVDNYTAIYVEKGISHATLGLETKITAHATAVNLCHKHETISTEVLPSNKKENDTSQMPNGMQIVMVLALCACVVGLTVLVYRCNGQKFLLLKW